MPRAYAEDLRIRLVQAVDGGMSARGAARLFAVAASTAIKWMQLWRQSGSIAAKARAGGRRRALDEHADRLLALAAAEPDLTLEEIRLRLAAQDVVVGIASIWRFFARHNLSFQKKRCAPPSRIARTFTTPARRGRPPWSPRKSVLHQTIGAIRAETWEAIDRALLASAAEAKLERGTVVRLDSTVTAALLHEPSDSSLLWDAVRVMTRLLREAQALGAGLVWRDHRRAAKRRARNIQYTRGRPRRVQLYRELITITRATVVWLRQAAAKLGAAADPAVALWQARVRHHLPLIERIIAQTERRVLAGAPVPAGDKLVSLFEPHADIILGFNPRTKGRREVAYGHKLNLTTGKSGLILDVVTRPATRRMPSAFCPCSSATSRSMARRRVSSPPTAATPAGAT